MRIKLNAPIYLIRHGQTDWNAEERFQGQRDIPLNIKGMAQAAGNGDKLASLLENPEDWAYLASPLTRTRQTMELIRAQLHLTPNLYETDARLKELSFGSWEGHTLEELERTVPDLVAARGESKWRFQPPEGESYNDLSIRVAPVFESIKVPTIIVAHGGVIRAFRKLFENIEEEAAANASTPQDKIYYADNGVAKWIGGDFSNE